MARLKAWVPQSSTYAGRAVSTAAHRDAGVLNLSVAAEGAHLRSGHLAGTCIRFPAHYRPRSLIGPRLGRNSSSSACLSLYHISRVMPLSPMLRACSFGPVFPNPVRKACGCAGLASFSNFSSRESSVAIFHPDLFYRQTASGFKAEKQSPRAPALPQASVSLQLRLRKGIHRQRFSTSSSTKKP